MHVQYYVINSLLGEVRKTRDERFCIQRHFKERVGRERAEERGMM